LRGLQLGGIGSSEDEEQKEQRQQQEDEMDGGFAGEGWG
jgi:hypothetical protein